MGRDYVSMILVQLPADLHNALVALVAKRPAEEVFDLLTAVVRHKTVIDTETRATAAPERFTPFLPE